MMGRIFGIVLGAAVLMLVALWLIGGGYERIKAGIRSTLNPMAIFIPGANDEGTIFRLPWQPDFSQFGPDITSQSTIDFDPSMIVGQIPEGDARNYSEQVEQRDAAESLGTPSPYARLAYFTNSDLYTTSPREEYLVIEMSQEIPSVSASDWTIENVSTGKRYSIPRATPLLRTGEVNTLERLIIDRPSQLIISSGKSPVGASFRENSCSLYLSQFQSFAPALAPVCASERDIRSDLFGEACASFLASIPRCTFTERFPAQIDGACRAYAQTRFTYNGCVSAHKGEPDFFLDSWRLYLNSETELWQDGNILRLLDAEGRVIDILRN